MKRQKSGDDTKVWHFVQKLSLLPDTVLLRTRIVYLLWHFWSFAGLMSSQRAKWALILTSHEKSPIQPRFKFQAKRLQDQCHVLCYCCAHHFFCLMLSCLVEYVLFWQMLCCLIVCPFNQGRDGIDAMSVLLCSCQNCWKQHQIHCTLKCRCILTKVRSHQQHNIICLSEERTNSSLVT